MTAEMFKAKFIKIEIDGITYAGFLQEVKEEAAETTPVPVVNGNYNSSGCS